MQRAVDDFVVVGRAGPAGEILAVEERLELGLSPLISARMLVGFVGRNLADEYVAEPRFGAVRLQIDRPAGVDRNLWGRSSFP